LITIIRAVGQLSRPDLPTRPGHAGWPVATPLAQCQGGEQLQLAVVPVNGSRGENESVLAELWEDAFLPIQPVWLRQASPLSIPSLDIRLEGSGLIFSGVKPPRSRRRARGISPGRYAVLTGRVPMSMCCMKFE
jgi:mannosylglycerate hydrolase